MPKEIEQNVLTWMSLVACGGGNSVNLGPVSSGADSIVLSGQVVDGPIAGAQVCLYSDGVKASTATGAAICSGQTDSQGNYSLTIPSNLPSGFLTLVASKDSNIKLTSALGLLSQVLKAAGNSGSLTSANLPNTRITHFTTADFVLGDTNNDGTVSRTDLDAYKSDYAKVRTVAAVIKAAIDGGQAAH